jgi:D-alanyl-D-alanine carboxypeptidase
MDHQLTRALQHQLERSQKFAPCLGCNVAIIDGLHGSWSGAAGYREIEAGEPMPTDACFYIYSITKTFVAARLLQLDIDLDCPISAFLKEPALPEGVTVRRLLNHTSGVPSYTDLPEYLPATCQSPGQPWSPDEVIRRCFGERPLDFPPGEGWHYSNTGYMLLAQLVTTVVGAPLKAAIANGILVPLALDKTYVADSVDNLVVTPGYTRQLSPDEHMIDVMPIYHPGWCLTGLLVSTVTDVARFLELLMSDRLLNATQLKAMTTPVATGGGAGPFFRNPSYGLGLMIDPDWGHGGLFGHGGDGPGANTWAMHLPDFQGRPLTLVAFCNTTMGGHPFYLVKDLLRVLAEV